MSKDFELHALAVHNSAFSRSFNLVLISQTTRPDPLLISPLSHPSITVQRLNCPNVIIFSADAQVRLFGSRGKIEGPTSA